MPWFELAYRIHYISKTFNCAVAKKKCSLWKAFFKAVIPDKTNILSVIKSYFCLALLSFSPFFKQRILSCSAGSLFKNNPSW